MPNDYFKFKQFVVRQNLCAMKVGTDGTLLGAWAQGGSHILDIGTGTGLIALMMSQRFPEAQLMAVDIDEKACEQAQQNVNESPFAHRIQVVQCNIADVLNEKDPRLYNQLTQQGLYDAIVSNPPYFEESLSCKNDQRTMARHTTMLSYRALIQSARLLLRDNGFLSLVIPFDCRTRLEQECYLHGFFPTRVCGVKTTPKKPVRRFLLEFRKHAPLQVEHSEGVIEIAPSVRSEWYRSLTDEFYLSDSVGNNDK